MDQPVIGRATSRSDTEFTRKPSCCQVKQPSVVEEYFAIASFLQFRLFVP